MVASNLSSASPVTREDLDGLKNRCRQLGLSVDVAEVEAHGFDSVEDDYRLLSACLEAAQKDLARTLVRRTVFHGLPHPAW